MGSEDIKYNCAGRNQVFGNVESIIKYELLKITAHDQLRALY